MMAGGIEHFLSLVGMQHHLNAFRMRGYDDESDIPHLNMSDLQTLGITNPMEIVIILKAAQSYKKRPQYELFRWLRELGLNHYFEGFFQSGWILLSDIAEMNLPDEQLYEELQITLPGHRRRLERAVSALRKRQRKEISDTDEDRMVTEGWWGFPSYLPSAKYPFLCVKANIQSTLQPENQKSVDFMVDSGSDVSTLRDDIIQELNLEPITTVRSCGAHGSVRTTMYRAYIAIGNSKLEIEIIGNSYDSLGSRVLRHFNHQIDSTRHRWFRASNKPSDENRATETETVSVLPDRERGASYASILQRNSESRTVGDGGSSSSSNGGDGGCDEGSSNSCSKSCATVTDKRPNDETDSLLLSTQRGYRQYTSYWERERTKGEILWDSTSLAYLPSCSTSQIQNNRVPMTISDNSAPVHVNCHWTDDVDMKSPKASHQEGHVMISEDGTISLSLSQEAGRKRH